MALELKHTPNNSDNFGGYYEEPEIRKYNPQIDLNADYNSKDFYAGSLHSPISGRKSFDVSYYSNIVLHGLFIFVSIIILGVGIIKPDDPVYYISLASTIESIIVIAIIVDAIIYNIFVEKNLLLLIFAFFFNGLYLLIKGKIVDGSISTASIIVFIIYVLSSITCVCSLITG